MATKSAILRVLPLVRNHLSQANTRRLDQLVAVTGEDGRPSLSDVLRALYPEKDNDTAQALLRQFRHAVALAAEEANVRFSIETDGQTRAKPADRQIWFEVEDRVAEAVTRMVEAEVEGVERSPQFAKEDRPMRFFVSYAHEDDTTNKYKTKLLNKLQPFLRTHPQAKFELWSDGEILPGEKWFDEIEAAMVACDFGLLLVSPAFLASQFITGKELPHLLANKRVIPVALKPLLLDGSMDLKGLGERQIFFDSSQKAFSDSTSDKPREAFALQLYQRICKLLTKPAGLPETPKHEHHLRQAFADFDTEHFVPTEGVPTTFTKNIEAPPEMDPANRKDAIDFLMEWIDDENSPPYCALLGEYGMGKTTTCKALARDLLQRRECNEKAPLPVYLDLRYVGRSAQDGLDLRQILERILKFGWKSGPGMDC